MSAPQVEVQLTASNGDTFFNILSMLYVQVLIATCLVKCSRVLPIDFAPVHDFKQEIQVRWLNEEYIKRVAVRLTNVG